MEPNRDLTERGATPPCFNGDHYESTHDECDKFPRKSGRRSARIRPRNPHHMEKRMGIHAQCIAGMCESKKL